MGQNKGLGRTGVICYLIYLLHSYPSCRFFTYASHFLASFRNQWILSIQFSGSRTRHVFSKLPLRLVSLAAIAQVRITLVSPTAHSIHPLLRWLCSLASMRQLHGLLVAGPVVSIRSTLDDVTLAPSSGPRGAETGTLRD